MWTYFSDADLADVIATNSSRQASAILIKKSRERAAGFNADNCTLAIIKLADAPKEEKNIVGRMECAV